MYTFTYIHIHTQILSNCIIATDLLIPVGGYKDQLTGNFNMKGGEISTKYRKTEWKIGRKNNLACAIFKAFD